jgi:hypothetical protein
MSIRRSMKVLFVASLITLPLATACDGNDSSSYVDDSLCDWPGGGGYIGCRDYAPPSDLQYEWDNGGWDAGTS